MKLFTKEQNLSEYNFSTFSHTFEWKPILNSELSTKVCPAGCTLQCTRPQRKILMIWRKLKKNEIFRRGKICAFLFRVYFLSVLFSTLFPTITFSKLLTLTSLSLLSSLLSGFLSRLSKLYHLVHLLCQFFYFF